jgi:hypothetical protein
MARNTKTAAELRGENRILRRFRTTEGFASVAITLVKWGAIVLMVRYGSIMVEALAGKVTVADIGIKIFTHMSISEALAWALGIGSAGYGVAQNRLRKRTVERLQDRIKKLETGKDPRRTSSRLTPRGETRPEDEV